MEHGGDPVDCLLHLLVIALVGLRDQFVDLAGGNLRENAVALADGKQDRVQHGVHAVNDLGVCPLELLWLAALGELAFLRGLGQAGHFLLQSLHHQRDVVHRQLHLLVVALVGLHNQLVDLAGGYLRQHPVALADGKQNRVQHGVDALDHLAIDSAELGLLAPLRQPPLARSLHQAKNLLRNQQRLGAVGRLLAVQPLAIHLVRAVHTAGRMRPPIRFRKSSLTFFSALSVGWCEMESFAVL